MRCTKFFSLVALLLCAVPQVFSQTSGEDAQETGLAELSLTSIRPLTEAALEVQQKLRVPINIEELALPLQTSGPLPSMTVRFVPHEKNPTSALSTIVTSYSQSGLPGTYSVTEQNGYLTILPVSLNGKAVMPVSQSKISVPFAERTVADTLDFIAAQVSRTAGVPVKVLDQPFIYGEKVQLSADDEPALAVLARLGEFVGPVASRFLWRAKTKSYYLIVTAVPEDLPPQPIIPTPGTSVDGKLTYSPFFERSK